MNNIVLIMLAILFVSGLNIVCFFIGARVGQKVVNKEIVEIPNPIKAIKDDIREHSEEKDALKEKEYYEAISHNIDIYNGTSIGQLDIPR